MRTITLIGLHCTGTQPNATIESMQQYWKTKGWKRDGYHYIIKPDGAVIQLIYESNISNGIAGKNAESINIAYIGGIDSKGKPKDTRTDAQKAATESLLVDLLKRYPDAQIAGHYEFANKACPSYIVPEWLREIGIKEKNIYKK